MLWASVRWCINQLDKSFIQQIWAGLFISFRLKTSNWGQSGSGNWVKKCCFGKLLLAVLVGTVWHWEPYKTLIQIPSESIIHYVSKWRCKRIFKVFSVISSAVCEQTKPLRAELKQWIIHRILTMYLMCPFSNLCDRLYSLILHQPNVRGIVYRCNQLWEVK